MKTIENFLNRLNKQFEMINSLDFVSKDPDELATMHVGPNGELYLDKVLLPYSVSDVVRICHKIYEDDEDYNYVKIYFKNDDWLSISVLADYEAKIEWDYYEDKEVKSAYYAITNKRLKKTYPSPEDVLTQIDHCADKAGVWIDVALEKDEDEDAAIWFDDKGTLWINYTICTPYTFKDVDSIDYFNSEDECYVRIAFKSEEEPDYIYVYGSKNYQISVSRGKLTHPGIYDKNKDIAHQYQNIIEARAQGIYQNEFVVLNGVLIRYNGNNKEIVIPEGVQIMEEGTFSGAPITSVKCPSTLKCIKKYCFFECYNLQKVDLNEGLETIEDGAFACCNRLTSISIPDSVICIEADAFFFCKHLTDIVVSNNNKTFCTVNGVLYNKDRTSIHSYPAGKPDTEYTIPDGVTSIMKEAFSRCDNLISIIIPSSVTSIGSFPLYLKEVRYHGTKNQWNTIEKADRPVPPVIHCADGDIVKNKN